MRSNSASTGRLDKHRTKKADTEPIKHTENSQIQDPNLDPALKQKIQQLMDTTQCSQDNAILALHDSDNDLNSAVLLLLDSENNMQGGWQEQKGKSKKKQTSQTTTVEEPDDDFGTSSAPDNDGWKESGRSSDRQYPRNAPPRMQRGGRRPDYRSREDGNKEFSSGERRFGNGERGRGRGRGGRGRGGSTRDGGFNSRGGEGGYRGNRGGFGGAENHSSGNQGELSDSPQIGTWTSEADANPKTDSWGDVWTEDDNQWQGDLKSTHVFESSAKADTFPTPTEFDPSVAAASLPVSSQHQMTSNLNGNSQPSSRPIDPLFPKPQVETYNPPSVSIYDNQLASDSIKSAIGMPTQQQQLGEVASKGGSKPQGDTTTPASVVGGLVPQPQRQNRQQRSKLPPPSTKIPIAPVEMPHTPASSIMSKLGVQFGAMDFTSETGGLSFQSSALGDGGVPGYPTTSSAVSSAQSLQINQQPLAGSLYASGTPQTGTGPEPIPFPNSSQSSNLNQQSQLQNRTQQSQSTQQQAANSNTSNNMYNSSPSGKAQVSQQHTIYNNSSSYKPNQSSSHSSTGNLPSQTDSSGHSAQSFQQANPRSSANSSTGGSGFYQLQQNLQDSRGGSGAGYQSNSQVSTQTTHSQHSSTPSQHSQQHSHQYNNSSLYSSSTGDHLHTQPSNYSSHHAYSAGVPSTTTGSTTAPISSHGTPLSSQSQQPAHHNMRVGSVTSKAPPNLPPPSTAAAAAPMMPYLLGAQGMPTYYNQGAYYNHNIEDMQKYQHQPMGYYDINQLNFANNSIGTFPGTAGSGDGKITRHDAQSPTVQGSQSTPNQSQQQAAPTNTQSHQQQYMSIPPGYSYYYPSAPVMPTLPYTAGIFQQMPSVTQNMSMPGSNTGVYANQKAGVNATSAASYYPGTASSTGYDDSMQSAHSSDYNKTVYGGTSKQATNLPGGNASNTDITSMYKSSNSSQGNMAVAPGNVYGGNPGAAAYMSAHGGAHIIPNQHLMQSQLGGAPNTQDSNVGGRGSQSVNMTKSHSKPNYYGGGGWGN